MPTTGTQPEFGSRPAFDFDKTKLTMADVLETRSVKVSKDLSFK